MALCQTLVGTYQQVDYLALEHARALLFVGGGLSVQARARSSKGMARMGGTSRGLVGGFSCPNGFEPSEDEGLLGACRRVSGRKGLVRMLHSADRSSFRSL